LQGSHAARLYSLDFAPFQDNKQKPMHQNPSDRPIEFREKRNQARRKVRRLLPYAGVLVLGAVIVAGLWPKPVPVETSRVTVGNLRATVSEEGKTRVQQRYLISAPVSGQLRRIPFKAGASVQAGKTVLAAIDPLSPALLDARSLSLAEARRDSAAANLEKARATHAFAASELRRIERLHAGQTVSAQELESAQLRETAAARDEAAAEGALRQAEAELAVFSATAGSEDMADPALVILKSPIDGQVLRVYEESARVVGPGTPLVELGDPDDLEVIIEVLSRDGAVIPPGAKVELDHWGGTSPLLARVRLVEPAAFTKISALGVEEQRVNVVADLVTPPGERRGLGDNFRVEARIIIWEDDQALKVPSGALFRRGEEWSAFAVVDGRARSRPVRVGRSSGTEVQVIEGLREGDEIIVYPGDRVRDGQRVRRIVI
jgi:HlyD family secretion protein